MMQQLLLVLRIFKQFYLQLHPGTSEAGAGQTQRRHRRGCEVLCFRSYHRHCRYRRPNYESGARTRKARRCLNAWKHDLWPLYHNCVTLAQDLLTVLNSLLSINLINYSSMFVLIHPLCYVALQGSYRLFCFLT